jgi:ribosomal protein S18 acetylase RimI-like enzyme
VQEVHAVAIEIKVLENGDDAVLANVAHGLFDNPIDPRLAAEFLADPRHHIAVAIDHDLVVGFASAVDYVHPDKPRELWINEVAVAPPHRGRGLGRAVLKAILQLGRDLRCTDAWVLTDRSNAAAMALYASVGGSEGVGGSGRDKPIVGFSFSL